MVELFNEKSIVELCCKKNVVDYAKYCKLCREKSVVELFNEKSIVELCCKNIVDYLVKKVW